MMEKARADVFFLGKMLSEYQEVNGLDDRGLAAVLRCSLPALSRLILCRCPDDRAAAFAEQVQAIATFGRCNADALMQLFRHVAAMRALREQPAESTGDLLIAARDRHDEHGNNPRLPPKRKRHGSRNDE
jgi:hypothetical protein